jgi:hypothetical protein
MKNNTQSSQIDNKISEAVQNGDIKTSDLKDKGVES